MRSSSAEEKAHRSGFVEFGRNKVYTSYFDTKIRGLRIEMNGVAHDLWLQASDIGKTLRDLVLNDTVPRSYLNGDTTSMDYTAIHDSTTVCPAGQIEAHAISRNEAPLLHGSGSADTFGGLFGLANSTNARFFSKQHNVAMDYAAAEAACHASDGNLARFSSSSQVREAFRACKQGFCFFGLSRCFQPHTQSPVTTNTRESQRMCQIPDSADPNDPKTFYEEAPRWSDGSIFFEEDDFNREEFLSSSGMAYQRNFSSIVHGIARNLCFRDTSEYDDFFNRRVEDCWAIGLDLGNACRQEDNAQWQPAPYTNYGKCTDTSTPEGTCTTQFENFASGLQEEGVVRDVGGHMIDVIPMSTFESCSAACHAARRCDFFTFNEPASGNACKMYTRFGSKTLTVDNHFFVNGTASGFPCSKDEFNRVQYIRTGCSHDRTKGPISRMASAICQKNDASSEIEIDSRYNMKTGTLLFFNMKRTNTQAETQSVRLGFVLDDHFRDQQHKKCTSGKSLGMIIRYIVTV